MFSRFRRTSLSWLLRLFAWGVGIPISLLMIGCGTPPAQAQPVETAWYLITANPRATPTSTPFQPVLFGNPTENTTLVPTVTEEVLPSPVNPFPSPAESPTPTPQQQLPTPGQIIDLSQIPTVMPLVAGRDTINFILLGSDTRGSTYFRTDTMVVAIVRLSTGEVSMISLPRDMWVNIPTVGMQRLNTAYQYGELYHYPGGGSALLRDTIQYNLGIPLITWPWWTLTAFVRS